MRTSQRSMGRPSGRARACVHGARCRRRGRRSPGRAADRRSRSWPARWRDTAATCARTRRRTSPGSRRRAARIARASASASGRSARADSRHRRQTRRALRDTPGSTSLSAGAYAPGKMCCAIHGLNCIGALRPMKCRRPRPWSRIEHAVDDGTKRRIVRRADVLEHADRHEGVALAVDRAVVAVDERHPIGQALARRAFARVAELLVGNIECAHGHAVVTGHVQRECAPATTRLDDAIARLQSQFAADVVELGALRVFERRPADLRSTRTCRPSPRRATVDRSRCQGRSARARCLSRTSDRRARAAVRVHTRGRPAHGSGPRATAPDRRSQPLVQLNTPDRRPAPDDVTAGSASRDL